MLENFQKYFFKVLGVALMKKIVLEHKLIIQAYNIHTGGGKILLDALLTDLEEINTIGLFDARFKTNKVNQKCIKIKSVSPSFWGRFKAELWMKYNIKQGDTLLCFGNIPPFFKSNAVSYLFLQNRLLLGVNNIKIGNIKSRIKLLLERWLLKKFIKNSDFVIVQSETMRQELLSAKLKIVKKIIVIPFMPNHNNNKLTIKHKEIQYDFIYIASGEPHKNYDNLLDAWVMLKNKGFNYSLIITLNKERHTLIYKKYKFLKSKYNLNILNIDDQPYEKINCLYKKAKTLIYPSKIESFGMPLIEAKRLGMPIIASERNYVRDLIDPVETFDPESPLSICRAVMRYNGKNNKEEILTPLDFINRLINS